MEEDVSLFTLGKQNYLEKGVKILMQLSILLMKQLRNVTFKEIIDKQMSLIKILSLTSTKPSTSK